jgi:hypothetical protein
VLVRLWWTILRLPPRRWSCALFCLVACEAHDQVLRWQGPDLGSGPGTLDAAVPAPDASQGETGISVSPIGSPSGGAMGASSEGGLEAGGATPGPGTTPDADAAPLGDASRPELDAAVPPLPALPVAKDPECDMNGIWLGRQVTRSEALLAGQFANNFYYLEYAQTGEDVVVVKHWNCGVEVRGSATCKVSRATAEALRAHNTQMGRKGKMYKGSDGTCHFEMERWWSARGVDELRFVPTPRNMRVSVAQMKMDKPLPVPQRPDGAEDWENDGKLGLAVQVTGILSGVRNSVQRDFTEWYTDPARPIAPARDWPQDLKVGVVFEGEELLFDPTTGLLAQLAQPDIAAKHLVTLRFLGRSAADPRATALLRADVFEMCLAVQTALPAKDTLD